MPRWTIALTLARHAFVICPFACVVVLAASIWPGLLPDLLVWTVLSSCFWLPLGLCALGALFAAWWRHPPPTPRRSPRLVLVAVASLVLTVFLLELSLPRRAAFELARPALDAALPSAPVSTNGGVPFDRWFGPFRVDRYGRDPRGGVYFRFRVAAFGLIDTVSYGVAHQPNPSGTPFGSAGYSLSPISGGWHWFIVSDDW